MELFVTFESNAFLKSLFGCEIRLAQYITHPKQKSRAQTCNVHAFYKYPSDWRMHILEKGVEAGAVYF